jgi:hypothetical protein
MPSAADGTTFNGSCRPGRRIPAQPAELRASLHARRSRERLDVLQAAAASGILTQDQAEVRMQATAEATAERRGGPGKPGRALERTVTAPALTRGGRGHRGPD